MNTPTPTAVLHAAISRLAAIPGVHDLTAKEVSDVLQQHQTSVTRLCEGENPPLESTRYESRKWKGKGLGKTTRRSRRAILIPRASLVRYLVRSTKGDRVIIMTAIAQDLPQFLGIAKEAAGLLPPLPANAIDGRDAFKAAKKRKTVDHAAGHAELFPELLNQGQSA